MPHFLFELGCLRMSWPINVSLKQTNKCYLKHFRQKKLIIQAASLTQLLEFVSSYNSELAQWIELHLFDGQFSSSCIQIIQIIIWCSPVIGLWGSLAFVLWLHVWLGPPFNCVCTLLFFIVHYFLVNQRFFFLILGWKETVSHIVSFYCQC